MISLIITYKYFMLLPLAILEGPIISMFAGYLSRVSYLDIVIATVVLIIADIISDLIYYFLGYYSTQNKKINTFLHAKFSDKKFDSFAKIWNNHMLSIMFFGKISYGISVPIIISAGVTKMPLKKFLTYSIPVSIFQTTGLVLLGYVLGEAYYTIIPYTKYPALFVACMFVAVIAVVYYLKVRSEKVLVP